MQSVTRHPSTPVRRVALVSALVASLGLGACGSLSESQRDTAVGAAIGGVAGSVLTDGSTVGTVGGAVIGGAIANERNKKK